MPLLVGGFGPAMGRCLGDDAGQVRRARFADERTARAELVGSANTLIRTVSGWRADNTDVDGVTGARAGAERSGAPSRPPTMATTPPSGVIATSAACDAPAFAQPS